MADAVFGSSRAYEVGEVVTARSSNVATVPGVGTGGPTVLNLELELPSNDSSTTVRVSRNSEIFATQWQPAEFDISPRASFEGTSLVVDVKARNRGWLTPSTSISAVAMFPDGSREEFAGTDRGPVGPLGETRISEAFPISREPTAVIVTFEWGNGMGQRSFDVELSKPPPSWVSKTLLGGYWLAVVAVGVAWVSLSTVVSRGRKLGFRIPKKPRRGLIAAIAAAVVLPAAILAYDWQGPSDAERASTALGPYPFPMTRELPLISSHDRNRAVAAVRSDQAISAISGGMAWETPLVLAATRHGEQFGAYVVLLFKEGLSSNHLWLPLGCDGSSGEPWQGPEGEIPGIAAIVDLETSRVIARQPLGGNPSGKLARSEFSPRSCG